MGWAVCLHLTPAVYVNRLQMTADTTFTTAENPPRHTHGVTRTNTGTAVWLSNTQRGFQEADRKWRDAEFSVMERQNDSSNHFNQT